jgi:hypothetical protein
MAADREPALRVVLLGASNLKISLPVLLSGIRQRAGGPVETLVACGHGRSYGTWSRFLFVRRLPGIADCGLWRELDERRPPRRTLALVTDVGNDLVYGAGAREIAGWVEACLDQLARHRAEVVLTLLPLARLAALSPWQMRLAVSLLFPGRPAPWPGLLERARELDELLRRMGRQHGARLVEPEAAWYSLDPIHLRRSVRTQVWDGVFSHAFPDGGAAQPGAARPRLPLLGAAELRLFGIPLRTPQPAVRLDDGTTIALF